MTLEFSRKDAEKYSNIKLYENPSSGNRTELLDADRETCEANSRFLQFCKVVQNFPHIVSALLFFYGY